MARPVITYKINGIENFRTVESCVYKLYYNTRYVVVKAKNCLGSLRAIQKSLNQYMKGYESQRKKDNLYRHFFQFIERNAGGEFKIQLALVSENSYKLLKMEQHLIKKAKKDKKCLQNRGGAYIPQWNEETQMYNWINRGTVMNFLRYKNKPMKEE